MLSHAKRSTHNSSDDDEIDADYVGRVKDAKRRQKHIKEETTTLRQEIHSARYRINKQYEQLMPSLTGSLPTAASAPASVKEEKKMRAEERRLQFSPRRALLEEDKISAAEESRVALRSRPSSGHFVPHSPAAVDATAKGGKRAVSGGRGHSALMRTNVHSATSTRKAKPVGDGRPATATTAIPPLPPQSQPQPQRPSTSRAQGKGRDDGPTWSSSSGGVCSNVEVQELGHVNNEGGRPPRGHVPANSTATPGSYPLESMKKKKARLLEAELTAWQERAKEVYDYQSIYVWGRTALDQALENELISVDSTDKVGRGGGGKPSQKKMCVVACGVLDTLMQILCEDVDLWHDLRRHIFGGIFLDFDNDDTLSKPKPALPPRKKKPFTLSEMLESNTTDSVAVAGGGAGSEVKFELQQEEQQDLERANMPGVPAAGATTAPEHHHEHPEVPKSAKRSGIDCARLAQYKLCDDALHDAEDRIQMLKDQLTKRSATLKSFGSVLNDVAKKADSKHMEMCFKTWYHYTERQHRRRLVFSAYVLRKTNAKRVANMFAAWKFLVKAAEARRAHRAVEEYKEVARDAKENLTQAVNAGREETVRELSKVKTTLTEERDLRERQFTAFTYELDNVNRERDMLQTDLGETDAERLLWRALWKDSAHANMQRMPCAVSPILIADAKNLHTTIKSFLALHGPDAPNIVAHELATNKGRRPSAQITITHHHHGGRRSSSTPTGGESSPIHSGDDNASEETGTEGSVFSTPSRASRSAASTTTTTTKLVTVPPAAFAGRSRGDDDDKSSVSGATVDSGGGAAPSTVLEPATAKQVEMARWQCLQDMKTALDKMLVDWSNHTLTELGVGRVVVSPEDLADGEVYMVLCAACTQGNFNSLTEEMEAEFGIRSGKTNLVKSASKLQQTLRSLPTQLEAYPILSPLLSHCTYAHDQMKEEHVLFPSESRQEWTSWLLSSLFSNFAIKQVSLFDDFGSSTAACAELALDSCSWEMLSEMHMVETMYRSQHSHSSHGSAGGGGLEGRSRGSVAGGHTTGLRRKSMAGGLLGSTTHRKSLGSSLKAPTMPKSSISDDGASSDWLHPGHNSGGRSPSPGNAMGRRERGSSIASNTTVNTVASSGDASQQRSVQNGDMTMTTDDASSIPPPSGSSSPKAKKKPTRKLSPKATPAGATATTAKKKKKHTTAKGSKSTSSPKRTTSPKQSSKSPHKKKQGANKPATGIAPSSGTAHHHGKTEFSTGSLGSQSPIGLRKSVAFVESPGGGGSSSVAMGHQHHPSVSPQDGKLTAFSGHTKGGLRSPLVMGFTSTSAFSMTPQTNSLGVGGSPQQHPHRSPRPLTLDPTALQQTSGGASSLSMSPGGRRNSIEPLGNSALGAIAAEEFSRPKGPLMSFGRECSDSEESDDSDGEAAEVTSSISGAEDGDTALSFEAADDDALINFNATISPSNAKGGASKRKPSISTGDGSETFSQSSNSTIVPVDGDSRAGSPSRRFQQAKRKKRAAAAAKRRAKVRDDCIFSRRKKEVVDVVGHDHEVFQQKTLYDEFVRRRWVWLHIARLVAAAVGSIGCLNKKAKPVARRGTSNIGGTSALNTSAGRDTSIFFAASPPQQQQLPKPRVDELSSSRRVSDGTSTTMTDDTSSSRAVPHTRALLEESTRSDAPSSVSGGVTTADKAAIVFRVPWDDSNN